MPTQIRCKECNQTLAEFDSLPPDVDWYSKILYEHGGKCPKCNHKLPDITEFPRKMQSKVEPKE